jgi:SAM-dependent methyltransferase
MHWRVKALVQGVFSRVPYGEGLNYWFQRHVTHSLPINAKGLDEIVERAGRHLAQVRRHLYRPLEDAVFFEFGAGWDLGSPLSFWAQGVRRQVLVDIRDLLRLDILNHTIGLFSRIATELPRKPAGALASIAELGPRFGIDYRAPCDARRTGLPARSLDCVTSSETLEHIPPDDIRAILIECRRCLREDGVMSFFIDYQDHYSFFDGNISAYNFLRYSEPIWSLYNPSLHYQNRLRHKDYLRLFDETGFDVVEEHRRPVSAEDLALVSRLPLDTRFRVYSPDELAIKEAMLVLRPRGGAA